MLTKLYISTYFKAFYLKATTFQNDIYYNIVYKINSKAHADFKQNLQVVSTVSKFPHWTYFSLLPIHQNSDLMQI